MPTNPLIVYMLHIYRVRDVTYSTQTGNYHDVHSLYMVTNTFLQ